MTLASCNCHCTYFNDGLCELAGHLDQGLPVICPYRQQPTGGFPPDPVTPGWEGLPLGFATARHHRYPASTKPPGRLR